MTPDLNSGRKSLKRAIGAMGSTARPPKAKKPRKPASHTPLAKALSLPPLEEL